MEDSMKIAIFFDRWTTTKAALAVAGALVVGGAVGSAVAIGPTVPAPITWQGGVNIIQDVVGPGASRVAYTVPAGRNLMLTDIVISNESATAAIAQRIFAGPGNCSVTGSAKTTRLTVPAEGSLHLPLVTGIGFSAGQTVCLYNLDADSETQWMLRGFLFTAA
jgi:hypothetical protein